MRLIIAEKPSMGRAIAQALGISGSGREYIEGRNEIVTWCIGHLVELAMPEDYDPALKRWTWDSLPIIPSPFTIKVTESSAKSQFYAVKKLLHDERVTEIVNACDSGREGELIFDLVYRLSGCKKPVLRLWTPSLTEEAIREAYANMKPAEAYVGLRDSARCRQEADWLVGINGTRAQTLFSYMKGHLKKGVASIGRVQTPVLNLVYLRDKEIENFVPTDFWTVLADLSTSGGNYTGKWFRKDSEGKEVDRFDREEDAKKLIASLKGLGAHVESVIQKDVKRPPEMLYDLTTLQRECNKRFGMTAEETLNVAQQLYEELRVISYPRTNSRHLTPAEEEKLPDLLAKLHKQEDYASIVDEIRSNSYDKKRLGKRFVDASKVEDHHAIIPTGQCSGSMNQKQKAVYDLIVRRMLAMYFPDRVEAKTTIITKIGEHFFKTNGTVCKEEGWSRIDPFTKEKKEEDNEETTLPTVKEGEAVGVDKIYSKKGKTTPPKPYTEDTLLGAMETAGKFVEDDELRAAMKDSGLGTPATRAAIIETLLKRKFIERKRTTIRVTEAGARLIESIDVEAIKSPTLTGEWEAKLSKMARGEYDRTRFMKEVIAFTEHLVQTIKNNAGTTEELARASQPRMEPTPIDKLCPKCSSSLLLNNWQGRFYVKCTAQNNKKCKVAYTTDETGEPVGDYCNQEGCDGPVQVTRNGSKICVKCEQWQESSRGGEVTNIVCESCEKENLRKIELKKGKGSFLACPNPECGFSRDVNAKVKKNACQAEGCGGTLVERKRKDKKGFFFACARKGCNYTENVDGTKSKYTRENTEKACPRCEKQKLALFKPIQSMEDGSGAFYACPDRGKCGFTLSYGARKRAVACPECGGIVLERKTKNNDRFWACAKCNYTEYR